MASRKSWPSGRRTIGSTICASCAARRPMATGKLKPQLQCKLNDAGVGGADDLSEAGADGYAGHAEIGVIEGVEKLRAELHADAVGKGEILCQIEIKIDQVGSAHDADAGIAEDLIGHEAGLAGSGAQGDEGAGIKPPIDGTAAVGEIAVGDAVRPAAPLAADIDHLGLIHGEGEAGLGGKDGGELPAAQQGIGGAIPILSISAPASEGELPDARRDKAVGDVEFGRDVFEASAFRILGLFELADVDAVADSAG